MRGEIVALTTELFDLCRVLVDRQLRGVALLCRQGERIGRLMRRQLCGGQLLAARTTAGSDSMKSCWAAAGDIGASPMAAIALNPPAAVAASMNATAVLRIRRIREAYGRLRPISNTSHTTPTEPSQWRRPLSGGARPTASLPPMAPAWTRHLPPGLDPTSVDLTAAGSLPAAWARRWSAAPDHPVIHDGVRWTTAGELDERTRRAADRYVDAGLEPGDRIVMSAATSLDLVVAHVAALRAGLVVVPVNGAYRSREVAQIASDCTPRAAVVDELAFGGWVKEASPHDVVIWTPGEVANPSVPSTGTPARRALDGATFDRSAPADDAMLCYTSGTTGTPKGARLTHRNILASPEALRIAWRWTEDDRLVLALPLFHVHGLGIGLHGALLAGASVVLVPRFEPDAVLDAARDHHATMFFGVPTMYDRLAASPRAAELASLRLCVSGSAPLPPALFTKLRDDAGTTVLERYGMTETLMNVSNPYDGERRAGTVGFPLPGVDLRLAVDGEILVRGPNVFPGYWHRPDANEAAFVDGGEGAPWFRTGDIGAYDADGYLAIVGRSKDLIISGGFNVYPREVEDVLRGHPGVGDVAVIGTASDEWGEVVTAVIVTDGPFDPDALLADAAEQLAPYKRPRIVRVVDELPRNALGKVLRHEL